jgi:hypothetical protein
MFGAALGIISHFRMRVMGGHGCSEAREGFRSLTFNLVCASTGLNEAEVRAAGNDPWMQDMETWDLNRYYTGAKAPPLRVTGDRQSGRLSGVQIVGHRPAAVAKRIDIFATALFHEMTSDALSDLDLNYTPVSDLAHTMPK